MELRFRPQFEKIVELLLYLAHKKPGADKYQAVKFFYLADKAHLERYGRPITQERYFALSYGPVASNAMDLLEEDPWTMQKAGISSLPFKLLRINRAGKGDLTALGDPLREVDADIFSRSELKVFDEVLEQYGDCSFGELYEITHSHRAYKKAWETRPHGSKAAPMLYEEMIESEELRKKIIEDIGPVAAHF